MVLYSSLLFSHFYSLSSKSVTSHFYSLGSKLFQLAQGLQNLTSAHAGVRLWLLLLNLRLLTLNTRPRRAFEKSSVSKYNYSAVVKEIIFYTLHALISLLSSRLFCLTREAPFPEHCHEENSSRHLSDEAKERLYVTRRAKHWANAREQPVLFILARQDFRRVEKCTVTFKLTQLRILLPAKNSSLSKK